MSFMKLYPKESDESICRPSEKTLPLYETILRSMNRRGVHSALHMSAAGFEYTGNQDTARCQECGLEISNWTLDMDPFAIHLKQKPDCPYSQSFTTSTLTKTLSPSFFTTVVQNTSVSNEDKNLSAYKFIEATDSQSLSNTLFETNLIQQVRKRTFSHWSHGKILSIDQMIDAGFFYCNISDRVICIYCNLICQQWTPHRDNPWEVHEMLSPNCPYVKAKLMNHGASPMVNDHQTSVRVPTLNQLPTANIPGQWQHVLAASPAHNNYQEISKREASFATWPHENLPPVDDLVRAGFFYTGKDTTVTCFYCNGSLQNWRAGDNSMVEHARWFPHCLYVKQLCGDEMFRQIQEALRTLQVCATVTVLTETGRSDIKLSAYLTTSDRPLVVPDEKKSAKLTAARLDLPVSQRLLHQHFELSVIERCLKDQLRLKHKLQKECCDLYFCGTVLEDDFKSDCDLYIACLILEKQIKYINGKKENIVIPNIKMKQIRDQNARVHQQRVARPNTTHWISNTTCVDQTTSTQSPTNDTTPLTVDDQIGELIQYY